MVYKWKNFQKGNPQKVGEEIEIINKENNNVITKESIVIFAKKNKKSELNKCFEWDDTKAASKYRLEQSRLILRELVIIKVDTSKSEKIKIKIRAYESTKEDGKFVFNATSKILDDKKLSNQVLTDIKISLQQIKNKFALYSYLIDNNKKIELMVDMVLEEIDKRITIQ